MERTTLPGKSNRQKWSWTKHRLNQLDEVLIILEELKEFLPLTVRQIYYQLVGKGLLSNVPRTSLTGKVSKKASAYQDLGMLLKFARIDNKIPSDCIEDKTRAYYDLSGWADVNEFIDSKKEYFLKGYQRDLLQTQDVYLEIWIEKNAISSIVNKIAKQYNICVTVTANNSVSNLFEYRERLEYHKHQRPIILYFGDFDPSGLMMLPAMHETLEREMNITGIRYKHIALEFEDIKKYNLPLDPDGVSGTKTLRNKHIAKYGRVVAELDALTTDVLEQKIQEAIESEIDMNAFYAEIAIQEEEFSILYKMRNKIIDQINKVRL